MKPRLECAVTTVFLMLIRRLDRTNFVGRDFKTRFNDVVRDVIKFAKKVPGFTALDLDDQVSLIKGGCFEVSNVQGKSLSTSGNSFLVFIS